MECVEISAKTVEAALEMFKEKGYTLASYEVLQSLNRVFSVLAVSQLSFVPIMKRIPLLKVLLTLKKKTKRALLRIVKSKSK